MGRLGAISRIAGFRSSTLAVNDGGRSFLERFVELLRRGDLDGNTFLFGAGVAVAVEEFVRRLAAVFATALEARGGTEESAGVRKIARMSRPVYAATAGASCDEGDGECCENGDDTQGNGKMHGGLLVSVDVNERSHSSIRRKRSIGIAREKFSYLKHHVAHRSIQLPMQGLLPPSELAFCGVRMIAQAEAVFRELRRAEVAIGFV